MILRLRSIDPFDDMHPVGMWILDSLTTTTPSILETDPFGCKHSQQLNTGRASNPSDASLAATSGSTLSPGVLKHPGMLMLFWITCICRPLCIDRLETPLIPRQPWQMYLASGIISRSFNN